jgi:predicted transcriptional regulator
MVVIARAHHDLAAGERLPEIFEERPRSGHRVARRAVAQLEHVAEQHEAIDILQGLQQRCARPGTTQHIRAQTAAEVQVGDD